MSEKSVNPMVKLGLELGPVVLFFVAYTRIKDREFEIFGQSYEGFIIATAAFIPVLLVSTGLLWWLTGKLSRMQLMTAVLVVVFGGMSIWFNDDRFFKMKPTIIYLLFGGLLGIGLLQGKSYLRTVMDEMVPMTHEGWMILTKRVCAFFLSLALANELVWRFMSTDAWVNFKTFGLTALVFVFFIVQGPLFARYSTEEDKSGT
ncbi:septation protein IspZ [Neptunicoccus cionae]|uniref:septation protein IspZ n=1 Tax=Neptunicoccus cionae TaxID=2035344 RepID=UPI000C773310|nr:septation protein IspZ [Amylibacter cionae]PLS21971.1 septation protein IspZ [Amylibacter cionae]